MLDRGKVAENLAEYLEMCIRNRVISESFSEVIISLTKAEEIFVLLKEQEESIPVSWLTEKLEGHPELSYAVTDGIINVLDLWGGR